MNTCNVIGRLAAAPETRYFESGSSVTQFRIAIDKGKDKQGNDLGAVWLPCKAWNKTGTLIADHFKKGQMIALTGSLDSEEWTAGTGEKRSKILLKVDRLTFLGRSESAPQAEPTGDFGEF